MGKTGAERLRESCERKKQKKKESNARFYWKNKDRILEDRKEQRRRKRPRIDEEQSGGSEVSKPNWRFYKARQRKREREEKERASSTSASVSPKSVRGAFANRTARKRAVDATKSSLPSSPRKKVAVVASLVNSPTTRQSLQRLGHVNTPENEEVQLATSILEDASEALQVTKRKRSNDARAATQVSLAFLCGEKVASNHLKSKVSKKLGINRKRLSSAFKHRTKTLTSSKSCWLYTDRQTRSDAIPTEHRKLAHDFWSSPGVSRPTGNKKDMVRKRLAVRTFVSHPKQILDKTQTEVF